MAWGLPARISGTGPTRRKRKVKIRNGEEMIGDIIQV